MQRFFWPEAKLGSRGFCRVRDVDIRNLSSSDTCSTNNVILGERKDWKRWCTSGADEPESSTSLDSSPEVTWNLASSTKLLGCVFFDELRLDWSMWCIFTYCIECVCVWVWLKLIDPKRDDWSLQSDPTRQKGLTVFDETSDRRKAGRSRCHWDATSRIAPLVKLHRVKRWWLGTPYFIYQGSELGPASCGFLCVSEILSIDGHWNLLSNIFRFYSKNFRGPNRPPFEEKGPWFKKMRAKDLATGHLGPESISTWGFMMWES